MKFAELYKNKKTKFCKKLYYKKKAEFYQHSLKFLVNPNTIKKTAKFYLNQPTSASQLKATQPIKTTKTGLRQRRPRKHPELDRRARRAAAQRRRLYEAQLRQGVPQGSELRRAQGQERCAHGDQAGAHIGAVRPAALSGAQRGRVHAAAAAACQGRQAQPRRVFRGRGRSRFGFLVLCIFFISCFLWIFFSVNRFSGGLIYLLGAFGAFLLIFCIS